MSEKFKQLADQIIQQVSQVLIGKNQQIRMTLSCFIAGGHLLLEDVPGLGKTTLAKGLANCFALDFKRIQCTPDLMPSDITGVTIYNQKSEVFEFIKGPVFSNILLADEVNRTNPRTQSALLEAMGEATVSIDRKTYQLEQPFFVIATQNPIEFSGTYPLPEAQMDRFMMKISLGYSSQSSEIKMMKSQQYDEKKPQVKTLFKADHILKLRQQAEKVLVSNDIFKYISDLTAATRKHPDLHMGASPRASLALMKCSQALSLLEGKNHVSPQIIQTLVRPVLEHRLLFKDRQLNEQGKHEFFTQFLQSVPVPDNPQAT